MKAVKLLLSFFLITCGLTSQAQEIFFLAGVSQEKLTDIKVMQSLVSYKYNVPLKKLQTFPSYAQFSGGFTWNLGKRMKIGFRLSGTSTGARNYYADYSGQIIQDFKLMNFGGGGRFEYSLLNKKNASLHAFGEIGRSFTQFKYTQSESGPINVNNSSTYYSFNYTTTIGATFRYRITGNLFAMVLAAYQLDFAGQFDDVVVDDFVSTNYNKADWSGLKLLAGIAYRYRK